MGFGRVVGRAERNADQIQAKREYQQATRHERLQEYADPFRAVASRSSG